MASWNQYINDLYYPQNTSADAPEKILYFFIRNGLCENPSDIEFKYKSESNSWSKLFDEIKWNQKDSEAFKNFKEYYLIKLQEGRGDPLPVPFHIDIPSTFKVLYSTGKIMENKGFGNTFLFTFLSTDEGINYDLIRELWEILIKKDGLNYYEKFLTESLIDLGYKEHEYKLKPKQVIESELRKYNLRKFICKHQPRQFQNDLAFILKLKLSRVEKINWINNLIYFHFSTYMMRIFFIISLEEKNFMNDESNLCSSCKGLHQCRYKGEIITKSPMSANNTKEARQVREEYKTLANNILVKGYYRFIAFNQLQKAYHGSIGKWPNNIREIAQLYKEKPKYFIEKLKDILSSYEELKENDVLDNYNLKEGDNVFSVVYEMYKYYYEIKGTKSADLATRQAYNLLAGEKGCGYLKTVRNGNHYFMFSSEFLTFITNVIIGVNRERVLLDEFWNQLQLRGFTYSSVREKEYIENQLSLMGHLDRKSDAGESQYVKKTVSY